MSTKLQQAIGAIKAGDKDAGRRLLAEILESDPRNEDAWLWMSGVADTDEQRRQCLERVLAISPDNETALRGMAMLQRKQAEQPSATASSQTEAQANLAEPSPLQELKATPSSEKRPKGDEPKPISRPAATLKLSKPIRILVGVGTAWLILYPLLFIAVWFTMFTGFMSLGEGVGPPAFVTSLFPAILPLHCLTIIIQLALMAFYLFHVIKNNAASDVLRVILGLGVFFLPYVAMPIYFFLYVWPQQPPKWASAKEFQHMSGVASESRKKGISKQSAVIIGVVIATVIVVFCLSGLGLYLLLSPRPSTMIPWPPRPPTVDRIIPQEIKDKVVWHRDNIRIRPYHDPSPGLSVGHGYVAFVTFTDESGNISNQLDVLDANTGAMLWQSEHFSSYETFAIGKDKALVLLSEGSPLNVYDIKGNGSSIASFDYFKEATQFYMFPPVVEESIYVYHYNWREDQFYLHNISIEGDKIASPRQIQAIGDNCCLFLFDEPFSLLTGQEFIGNNFETEEVLWRIPASGRVDSWPVLRDGTVFIVAGDGKRYAITALDITNGRELWKTGEEFGSNVVLHQDSLYALRNDAVLIKIDPATGQIEAEISFYPASIDGGIWDYWLASDEERLLVYFGDSQDLFAFDLSN